MAGESILIVEDDGILATHLHLSLTRLAGELNGIAAAERIRSSSVFPSYSSRAIPRNP